MFEQAYRLDNSHDEPKYNKVICYSHLNEWEHSISLILELSDTIPDEIDKLEYLSAVVHSYHNRYQVSKDETDKQQVINACESLLQIDKKDKTISTILESYQDRKPWWRL